MNKFLNEYSAAGKRTLERGRLRIHEKPWLGVLAGRGRKEAIKEIQLSQGWEIHLGHFLFFIFLVTFFKHTKKEKRVCDSIV